MRTDADRDDEPEVESASASTDSRSVAELMRELEEANERWQRARADYQNLKRRAQLDFEVSLRREVQPLLEGLLLVLDYLELALATKVESPDGKGLYEGVRLTRDQLVRVLSDQGVTTIRESGTFDPTEHQAVASVETDSVPPGHVVDVIRRGYAWNGLSLRPAQVRVASGAATGAAQAEPGTEPTRETGADEDAAS